MSSNYCSKMSSNSVSSPVKKMQLCKRARLDLLIAIPRPMSKAPFDVNLESFDYGFSRNLVRIAPWSVLHKIKETKPLDHLVKLQRGYIVEEVCFYPPVDEKLTPSFSVRHDLNLSAEFLADHAEEIFPRSITICRVKTGFYQIGKLMRNWSPVNVYIQSCEFTADELAQVIPPKSVQFLSISNCVVDKKFDFTVVAGLMANASKLLLNCKSMNMSLQNLRVLFNEVDTVDRPSDPPRYICIDHVDKKIDARDFYEMFPSNCPPRSIIRLDYKTLNSERWTKLEEMRYNFADMPSPPIAKKIYKFNSFEFKVVYSGKTRYPKPELCWSD